MTGIDLFSAGDFSGGDGTEEIVMQRPQGGVKKLVIKDDKLVGACLYGDTVDGSWYFKLLREGAAASGEIRDKLMFGQLTSEHRRRRARGHSKAAAMADDDEVCGCNGVTKGAICKAIKDKGLFTLDDVRKRTKASSSCGSCTGRSSSCMMFTAGGDFQRDADRRPICAAPDRKPPGGARRDPRAAPAERRFDVRRARLEARPTAAPRCRPAVNYYLISTWPQEAPKDDRSRRFINERSHANIQKDGTYSVVPRMWGGETSRRTAPHRRRGRQVRDPDRQGNRRPARIDLLGVKKKDLSRCGRTWHALRSRLRQRRCAR